MTDITITSGNSAGSSCRNIILIGMPGAGKSTVGPLLADKLGYSFKDTDIMVKEKNGRQLKDIVAEDGFEVFLEIQRETILLENFCRCVIATGGSVVMNHETMQYLKKIGRIVYLELDFHTLQQRLSPDRRLARSGGQTFRQLYELRDPLYVKYAEKKIICTDKKPYEIVEEIFNELFCNVGRTNSNG